MIIVTSCRPMGDDPEYDANQLRAKASWELVASAIVYFNDPQPQLASPKTNFIPAPPYPPVIDMVDLAADQTEWVAIANSDIVITPIMIHLEKRLKSRKAVAAASWRFEFEPAIGINPCRHVDNGLDFFAAVPGAWAQVYEQMHRTPQGEADAAKHLKFGAPSWDSWMLGTFNKLFSTRGFYNLSGSKCIRHPKHGGRKHGAGVPPVHLLAWPVMPTQDV